MPSPDSRDGLLAAAESLGCAMDVPQAERLLAYLALLQKWNKVYNLTALRDPGQMLTQHLVDSLAVVAPLSRHLAGRPARVLDVGSGGGLPGVVLACMCPSLQVTCIDAVAKKASFIRQVAAELGLRNLQSLHGRVEALRPAAESGFDVITSRAFASLADFVRLTVDSLDGGGVWMAMKGHEPLDEIAALPGIVTVMRVEPLVVPGLDAARCLVWMRPASSDVTPP